MSQAEEMFCDLIGLRVFGTGYLHAFAYLLAPGESIRWDTTYPTLPQRVHYMVTAAPTYGVAVPADYALLFQNVSPPTTSKEAFLLSVAEEAVATVAPGMTTKVDQIASTQGVDPIGVAEVGRIAASFRSLIPDGRAKSLPEVIDAAWTVSHTPDLWTEYPQIARRHGVVLNELVLKTVQVLEFNTLTKAAP
jgi:hypothetical protein